MPTTNAHRFPLALRTMSRGTTYFSHAPQEEKLAPTVSIIGPPAGSPLSPGTRVEVAVDDTVKLGTVVLLATLGDGSEEWVHNGSRFSNRYTESTKTIESDRRYVFSLKRSGGWPDGSLEVQAIAIDVAGNVAG